MVLIAKEDSTEAARIDVDQTGAMQLGGAGGPHKIAPSGKELDLCEGPDDLISTADATHLNLVAFSASTQTETHYIMELFDVELVPRVVRPWPPIPRIAG